MMNVTDEMREAHHALERLSASDPAVSANMLRHVAGYAIMLTGRRGRERRGNEPQTGAGFLLKHGNEKLVPAAIRRSGTDYLYVAFDVDDAAGPPVTAGVFRKEGDHMMVYGNCRLWSPANDGRALLVPLGEGPYVGHFAFRASQPFKLVTSTMPGNLEAGFKRADARMARLMASDGLRDVHREGYMHVIQNHGEDIYAETQAVAA